MPHDDSTRQAIALVAQPRALGSEEHRAGMARFGVDIEHASGGALHACARPQGGMATIQMAACKSAQEPAGGATP